MVEFREDGGSEIEYAVTAYGVTSMPADERIRLTTVFREVLEAILGSPKKVVDAQYDFNRVIDKYAGLPLPITAMGDEHLIVSRWENAYNAAFGAAFAALFGALDNIPEDAHFEITSEKPEF